VRAKPVPLLKKKPQDWGVGGEREKLGGEKMWEVSILEAAFNNGIWAVLFVGLMVYILKDAAKREKKYCELNEESQKIIKSLAEDLSVVRDMKKDIKCIREVLREKLEKRANEKSTEK